MSLHRAPTRVRCRVVDRQPIPNCPLFRRATVEIEVDGPTVSPALISRPVTTVRFDLTVGRSETDAAIARAAEDGASDILRDHLRALRIGAAYGDPVELAA